MPVRRAGGLEEFFRAAIEFGKDGMLADPPEPVTGIGRVGFYAMNDAMPVTSLRGVDVLRNCVTLSPAPDAEEQAGECGPGMRGLGEEDRRIHRSNAAGIACGPQGSSD